MLAHETLGEIHALLGQYDGVSYYDAPEYGYKYPGTLDADDMYLALKGADPSIQGREASNHRR